MDKLKLGHWPQSASILLEACATVVGAAQKHPADYTGSHVYTISCATLEKVKKAIDRATVSLPFN